MVDTGSEVEVLVVVACGCVVVVAVDGDAAMTVVGAVMVASSSGDEHPAASSAIPNSVTRTRLKPNLMVGGYGQFTYHFNYWGPTGCNRDTHILVRKLTRLEW